MKLRGFRIELGEIESLLNRHVSIREAAVAARAFSPGDQRLVAYLVPGSETIPTAGELRAYLNAQLPDFMIPSAFVWLE